jgi:hypothetical protein
LELVAEIVTIADNTDFELSEVLAFAVAVNESPLDLD